MIGEPVKSDVDDGDGVYIYIFLVSAWCFIAVLRFPPTFRRHFGRVRRKVPPGLNVFDSCVSFFALTMCVGAHPYRELNTSTIKVERWVWL